MNSREHTHGVHGTNANVRSTQGKGGISERGSAREMFSLKHYEDELEEWYETGEPPAKYGWSPPPLYPVDGRKLEKLLTLAQRNPVIRRLHCAWLTLRHGPEYWSEW
jgi:hypothetical protein